jgi:hypothetical protein
MQNLTKNKQFAEDEARQLRCCGVSSARVQKVIAYEVITERVLSRGHGPLTETPGVDRR